ncbi:TlpA family protein disulfide reductase [Fluoribacter dumoffii]|uniref:Thiol-disulfide oxidoreductase resA n=1 Tax=Fluoribacter dumoffii TaxID=463 RepID=A0A377G6J4_9GAMM|nr:TlpA disulfide reductase family protein [Fluoribacter dumoffii]KTC91503.1 thiol-disulfide oxidoreductase [Fluoribacter dumoffii NY 23]MCW8387373.1 TlpA family protein disulfide reductase [Fluoribacter dumoffii]MCW8417120.1 TlpA family protein disulfide reductase [Fluoribacter dumoffii]MCW8455040.1 TlpA family protein disulfide reductase [Fluoribacter dumoffii]MCW8460883.1 TlpA family protein disulfide reductase [Fluoribacter dumoffii]
MNSKIKNLLRAFVLMSLAPLSQADVLLKDTLGNTIPFSSLKGKWVLINYWAGWCKTCIDEIPELNRFYEKHEKDPVVLFAVNYDGLPLHKQKKLIQKFNIRYPSLATDPAFALGLGDIIGVPVTFVINPQGELANTLYGGQDLKTLDMEIGKG